MIRQATFKDVEDIYLLIKEFQTESLNEYMMSFRFATLYHTIMKHISIGIVLVLDKEGIKGVIGGMLMPSMFDSNELISQETMWYVTKSERGREGLKLLNAFEDESRKRGAKFIIMVGMGNLNNGELTRLYSKRKYQLLERQYIKGV